MNRAWVMISAALSLCCASGAFADPMDPGTERAAPSNRYEITPFVGYRLGGNFDIANSDQHADLDDHGSLALALAVRRDSSSQYELLYTREETQVERASPVAPLDVNVEYLHLGGTLEPELEGDFPLQPYILGGLGITRFTADSGTDDTRFSVSLGGGVRVPVSQRFSVRLEARGYLTFVNTSSAIFCASGSFGGVCAIRARGSTFTQVDLLLGAAFAF
ncbi:MAG TPA: outer membrane beta-barrel protein [Steroidobacteraceae bacterium]|nr:outer membrane beta-barrel protein [Steroidobacteraceae bacterium]